jgi:IclR family acetate operon transcriptional repressor
VTARFSVLADASPAVIAARDAARPHLRVLREKVQGWPGMFVLDGDRMVLLAGPEETTLRSLEATEGPLPVHLSAAGRAILAHLPDDTVEEILERARPPGAEADPALARHVRAAVTRARRDGYAVVAGEYAEDLGVVAAAVLDDTGTPIAALSVMIPVDRLHRGGATEFGDLLVEAAAEVSASVGGAAPVG